MTKILVLREPGQAETHLDYAETEVRLGVQTYTDGTTTEVIIMDPDDAEKYLGRGVARRRKGDPRNPDVGYSFGLARALRDLADNLEADAR